MAESIYIVTAINTVAEGNAVVITSTQHSTRLGAEEQYHTKLAAAARNTQYPVASVILATNEGATLASQCYKHEVQPQPEPEPEQE